MPKPVVVTFVLRVLVAITVLVMAAIVLLGLYAQLALQYYR